MESKELDDYPYLRNMKEYTIDSEDESMWKIRENMSQEFIKVNGVKDSYKFELMQETREIMDEKIRLMEREKTDSLELSKKITVHNYEFCDLFADLCLLLFKELETTDSFKKDNKMIGSIANLYMSTVTSFKNLNSVPSKIQKLCNQSVEFCKSFMKKEFDKTLTNNSYVQYKLEKTIAQMVIDELDKLENSQDIFTTGLSRSYPDARTLEKMIVNSNKNFIIIVPVKLDEDNWTSLENSEYFKMSKITMTRAYILSKYLIISNNYNVQNVYKIVKTEIGRTRRDDHLKLILQSSNDEKTNFTYVEGHKLILGCASKYNNCDSV
jgi:hypothetical protein